MWKVKIWFVGKGLNGLKTHQSQYPSTGLFSPGYNPAYRSHRTILFSFKGKTQMPPGTNWTFPAHTPASNSHWVPCAFCLHYPLPSKGYWGKSWTKLSPFQRQIREYPLWSHNKLSLSFPLLQNKVAFKRRVSGFVSQTPWGSQGNRVTSFPVWVTTDSEEGVEGHGKQSPSPS